MHNEATFSGVELDRNYPHVEKVDSLVDEAIAIAMMRSSTASAPMLDDSKFVHQFVKAAHVCRRSHHVDSLKWNSIEERVLGYLRSICPRFEVHHDDDWSIDTLYHEWDKLDAPLRYSDAEVYDREDLTDDGDSIEDASYEVHEYRLYAAAEYEFFQE